MIYFLAIIGLIAAVSGVWIHGRSTGIDEQKEIDRPTIQTLGAQKAGLEAANKRFVDDLNAVRGDIDQCNAKVQDLRAGSDEAIAALATIKAESEKRQKDYQRILSDYKTQMAAARALPPDQQCTAAKTVLMNLSDNMRALDALGLPVPATATTNQDTLKIEDGPPSPRPKPRPGGQR